MNVDEYIGCDKRPPESELPMPRLRKPGNNDMNYTVIPLTDHGIGAEILGLDATKPISEQTRKRLNADLAEHHVIAVRDQKFTPDQFMQAAGIFGEIKPHHKDTRFKPGDAAARPRVSEIRNTEIAPGKYVVVQGSSYHTDHSNDPVPPKATMLYPVALPRNGGDTQFVDMHNAYDDLSPAMKQRIDGLKAVHAYQSRFSPRPLRKLDAESLRNLPPPAVHPLVRTHPENGRRFLYINPVRIDAILGMPDDEAQALIKEIVAHATQPKYEYRHKWRYGDMLIWDDRSVLHQANTDSEMTELRHLYRAMIQGTPLKNETPQGAMESR